MHFRKSIAVGAAATSMVMVLAGCGASGQDKAGAASDDRTLSFHTSEPKSLLPHQMPGSQIAMAMCANLVEMNVETQEYEPLAAKSVESDDAKHWTIELRTGWTFHDGSPVTASSYVNAWNKTALGSNAWYGNGWFAGFEGYKAMNPTDGSKAKTDKLSGAVAVDNDTIKVTLTEPNADFPKVLSTNPLCPLPKQAFAYPEKYEQHPVSNGPYKFVSWAHNEKVVLKKWDGFKGPDAFSGGADKLIGKIYTSVQSAYTDMTAGNLDMIRNVPAPMIGRAKSQLGEEALYEVKTQSKQFTLQIPSYVEELKDPNLRRAISLSIDRESIANSLLQGYAAPSDSLVPPSLDSYEEGACEACTFDPAKAKKLLNRAEGFNGTLKIHYNSDSNQQLVQAIAKQIQDNLGIKVQLKPSLGTKLQSLRNNSKLTGALFGLWGWAYKSPDQYLSQYETGGDGNVTTGYSNPEVDALIKKARGTLDEAKRADLYAQVEQLVLEDMPAIPLFIPKDYGLHTKCVGMNDVQGDLQFYRADYTC